MDWERLGTLGGGKNTCRRLETFGTCAAKGDGTAKVACIFFPKHNVEGLLLSWP